MNRISAIGDSTARARSFNVVSDCRAPNPGSIPGGAEQNPQVPLASEDADLRQVPGNAETAVGLFFHHPFPHAAPGAGLLVPDLTIPTKGGRAGWRPAHGHLKKP
ncbi:MAG TPA: hypothetical protein VGY98_14835 [Verrucomicrobiae bacterium]|nr:hypothetical protein [Verrucomicrobiae bacterium]